MSSGLSFSEVYSRLSDATQMVGGFFFSTNHLKLFKEKSTAAYASSQAVVAPPEEVWYYSSGTSNILSQLVKEATGGTLGSFYKWSREEVPEE